MWQVKAKGQATGRYVERKLKVLPELLALPPKAKIYSCFFRTRDTAGRGRRHRLIAPSNHIERCQVQRGGLAYIHRQGARGHGKSITPAHSPHSSSGGTHSHTLTDCCPVLARIPPLCRLLCPACLLCPSLPWQRICRACREEGAALPWCRRRRSSAASGSATGAPGSPRLGTRCCKNN